MTTIEFAEIPAGAFVMGNDHACHPEDGEGPARQIRLAGYSIAKTGVSTAEFAAFVAATGYLTTAERLGGSQVFRGQIASTREHPVVSPTVPWWRWVERASWRYPDGSKEGPDDLPVVHVSRHDALAYCEWAGLRLPTEAEWERAAGSQAGIAPHIWQGEFPDAPIGTPGPRPVSDAEPNEFGLRHACGNVWEWTADRFARLHSPRPDSNPKGPLNGSNYVVKGGSFLCSASYCARYKPTSRRAERPDATTSHLGFRVAA